MFDGLKNLAGMASIMKDLPKMQARIEQLKDELPYELAVMIDTIAPLKLTKAAIDLSDGKYHKSWLE